MIVSETIIKLGEEGEKILVEILKRMRIGDSKLICPILKALEISDITGSAFDFVCEELIKYLKSDLLQVRKACLAVISVLCRRIREYNASLDRTRELQCRV